MFKFFISSSNLKLISNCENPFKIFKLNQTSNTISYINNEKNQQAKDQNKGEAKPKQTPKKEEGKKAPPLKEEKKAEPVTKESTTKKQDETAKNTQAAEKQKEKSQTQEPVKNSVEKKTPETDSSPKAVAVTNIEYYKSLISKLNPDWKTLNSQKQINNKHEIAEELLPNQRRFVEIIASKLTKMNYYQIHYVLSQCNSRLGGIQEISPLGYSPEWDNIQKQIGEDFSGEAKFTDYEEIMKDLSKWYQTQLPGFGIGIASTTAVGTKEVIEEKKEAKKEEKKEKEIYDIEMTTYDASKKINLIKEVRGILNLGLKESKELVEKVPCILMKGVKKADIEAIVKKLSDNGAVINLK